MRRMLFVFSLLTAAVCLNAQVLEVLPAVKNTPESAQIAFVTVLKNTEYMEQYSYPMQQIEDHKLYSNTETQKKYTDYITSILNNMSCEKVKAYILSVDNAFKKIDYSSLSRAQASRIEDFLQSGAMERSDPVFYVGVFERHPIPEFAVLTEDTTTLDQIDSQISKLEPQLAEMTRIFNSMENPEVEKTRKLNEINAEKQSLENRKPRTSAEMQQIQNRINELRAQDREVRTKPTPLAVQYDSLKRQIPEATNILQSLKQRRTAELEKIQKNAERQYRQQFCDQVNKLQTWVDYFNGKNAVVKELLLLLEIKPHLYSIVENQFPQKDVQAYTARLDTFFAGWGL